MCLIKYIILENVRYGGISVLKRAAIINNLNISYEIIIQAGAWAYLEQNNTSS